MARQLQNLEYNSFVKGFITEAGPLTFPENATIAEENFVLNKDGSRYRRLGMDYEPSFSQITVTAPVEKSGLALKTFVWKNAGGLASKELLVVQSGSVLKFFDAAKETISTSLIATFNGDTSEYEAASFASVNGILIMATGAPLLTSYYYNGTTVTRGSGRLKIRDFFGVEDIDISTGKDLREGLGLTYRPPLSAPNSYHIYNLRNQSFGLPRKDFNLENIIDPIQSFLSQTGYFPSNSDSVNYALYPDAQREQNRLVERFFPKDLFDNPPGNFAAPNGFFVIDALSRGPSRTEQISLLADSYPELIYPNLGFPADTTTEGSRVVQEFSGRIFYAGFGDRLSGGDKYSPRLGSYLLFSQLVKHEANLYKCYQEADPTSNIFSDLVPTDGGFLRIEGAYGIIKMEVIGNSLIVFARNGVWAVTGGSDYGFEATNYKVEKLSEHGTPSEGSVVTVDGAVFYWGESGIYAISYDQYGKLVSQNITSATIQKFYDDIPATQKILCKGAHDSYKKQVRWVYNNDVGSTEPTSELILDTGLGAFYISSIKTISSGLPKVVSVFKTPSFREFEQEELITVSGGAVTVSTEDVVITQSVRENFTAELKYLVVTSLSPFRYTFCYYRDLTFVDWKSSNSVGVDASAFMITGWTTLGDTQREKVNPYISFHFNKTEDGFEGDFVPTGQSSCLVQAQWEWSNSERSNRWGRSFQAYRLNRFYIPVDINDKFDNGQGVVTTKNKLRGWGKALSLKISTEPLKDCQILGWSQLIGIETDV